MFSITFSQENSFLLSIEIQKNPNDFFLQSKIELKQKKQLLSIGQGLGINKTIFQKSIFPKWQISYSFALINYKKIKFYSGFEFNYSNLKWNQNKNLYWHYFDYSLCFQIELLEKSPFYVKSNIGFFSELGNPKLQNNLNYILGLGWKPIEFSKKVLGRTN